jgi:hypothetical protein
VALLLCETRPYDLFEFVARKSTHTATMEKATRVRTCGTECQHARNSQPHVSPRIIIAPHATQLISLQFKSQSPSCSPPIFPSHPLLLAFSSPRTSLLTERIKQTAKQKTHTLRLPPGLHDRHPATIFLDCLDIIPES